MKFAPLLIGSLVILSACTTSPASPVSSDSSASSSVAAVKGDWVRYELPVGGLEKQGFSFEYPKGWNVFNDDGDGILYIRPTTNGLGGSIDLDYCGIDCGSVSPCENAETETLPGTSLQACRRADGNGWWLKSVTMGEREFFMSVMITDEDDLRVAPVVEHVTRTLRTL